MTQIPKKQMRVLAIAPSVRGFGFAVFEAQTLVDWGVKRVKGDKNAVSLSKAEEIIRHYNPEILLLEDASARGSLRADRIRSLTMELAGMGETFGTRVIQLTRQEVRQLFFRGEKGSKEAQAAMLAKWFPEELSFRLPPKRRPWMSEDSRMDIFDAVALCVSFHAMQPE